MPAKEHRCRECYRPYEVEAVRESDKEFFDGGSPDTFCSLKCAIRNWQIAAKVPQAFWDLDRSRLNCGEQIKQAELWLRDRNDHKGLPGLLNHGPISGTGKTVVGSHIISRYCGKRWSGPESEEETIKDGCGVTGLWFNVGRFRQGYMRVMREAEAKGEWMAELTEAGILFLDDVDKLKPSEGLLELVFSVLDDRLSVNNPTILTTNLTGELLAERWGDEYGPYLVRRLRDFCVTVDFDIEPAANIVELKSA